MKTSTNATKRLLTAALLSASALVLSGCGRTAFIVSQTTQSQKAPGAFIVPAKVDFLLAEDDTGSIKEIYGQIAQQMPQFLAGLEAKGWDYHFATTTLSTDRALNQAVASRHDSNWGASWTAPYPGAPFPTPGSLAPPIFRTPTTYTGFLSYLDTTNALNGIENGFETIRTTLYDRATGTNFVRNDAMLVVLVVGNGDDTSKVNYCPRVDGVVVSCEQAGKPVCTDISQAGTSDCASRALSFGYYKSQLQALKSVASQAKFYAAVGDGRANCLGGPSYAGTRYAQMAGEMGGETYNVCAQSVSNVLTSLSASLQNQRLAMRTRYLFIDREPDVSTIKVVKYLNGSAAVTIPQDATNGWTYAGYLTNVFAIDLPVPMNVSSGFGIELHGSAKLVGDDTADVTFLQKGVGNAAN